MMGADYYETELEIASMLLEGKVPIGVGENTRIRSDQCLNRNTNVSFIQYCFLDGFVFPQELHYRHEREDWKKCGD